MKFAVAFALVACVISSHAAPALREVDWNAVSSKIEEIEVGDRSAVDQIKTIAKDDNDKVGSSISDQLDAISANVRAVLQQAKDAASDHVLTEGRARNQMGKINIMCTQFQTNLQEDLGELSDAAASKIGDIFHDTHVSAEKKATELYALLNQ